MGGAVLAGKHLEPIAWREGLHYVRARRRQWLHVPDVNESAIRDPDRAVALLDDASVAVE